MKSIIFNQHQVNHALKNEEGMFRTICKFRPINPKFTPKMFDLWEIGGKTFSRPQFKVGETIFVKESSCRGRIIYNRKTIGTCPDIHYWADGNPKAGVWRKTKPAQHMKQEHSRLTLRIKSVKVERLQDISDEDCWKEGLDTSSDYADYAVRQSVKEGKSEVGARDYFREKWNSTHKKPEEKWEASPWVFCYEYEVVR